MSRVRKYNSCLVIVVSMAYAFIMCQKVQAEPAKLKPGSQFVMVRLCAEPSLEKAARIIEASVTELSRVSGMAERVETLQGSVSDCGSPDDISRLSPAADYVLSGKVSRSFAGAEKISVELHLQKSKGAGNVLSLIGEGDLNSPESVSFEFINRLIETVSGRRGTFGEEILFVEKDGRDFTLKSLTPGMQEQERVSSDRSLLISPSWSRAGKIYFVSYLKRYPILFSLDRKTGKTESLIDNKGKLYGARVSPDGAWIAATTSSFGSVNLDLYDKKGAFLKRITSGKWIDATPSFSGDASYVAFTSSRSGSPQVYIVPVEGGEAELISRTESNYCTSPSWSPDGGQIAYTCMADGGVQVFISGFSGKKETRKITSSGWNEDPVFSPDGQFLAVSFSPVLGQPCRLAIISLIDGKSRVISQGGESQRQPYWSLSASYQ